MSAPPIPDADQSVEARAIGPYSVVTALPLGSGQPITSQQIDWLFDRGLAGLLSDFAMLKCDVAATRIDSYESLVRKEPIAWPWHRERDLLIETPDHPSFATNPISERLIRVTLLLGCLGIDLSLSDGRLALRYESPNDPSSWSFGEVTRAETFDEATKEPVVGGLFCPTIFGDPKKHYRLGHVELASPLVPVHLRKTVLALLGRDGSRLLESIFMNGALELDEALASVDIDARLATLAVDHPERGPIEAVRASGISPRELLWRVMPVLPPRHRPLTLLADGRWATSDITDLYFLFMEANLRCKRAIEDNRDAAVLGSKRAGMAIAMDELLADGNRTQRPNKPFRSIAENALDHLRLPGEQKTDYSGRAVARIDESRANVGAPIAMLEELCRPIVYGELERRGITKTLKESKLRFASDSKLRREIIAEIFRDWPVLLTMGECFVGAMVEPIEENVFRLPRAVATRVGLDWDGNAVMLHLPLNEEAKKETLRLIEQEPAPRSHPHDGLLSTLPEDRAAALDLLVGAALENEVDLSETSGIAFLVGGFPLATNAPVTVMNDSL